ncbi:MAG: hypothetical protein MUC60_17300 [Oscillatoria sp. Prado101]|nr:hypothetical protein [Oscillatoria sp. Prado101]
MRSAKGANPKAIAPADVTSRRFRPQGKAASSPLYSKTAVSRVPDCPKQKHSPIIFL